jgi:hypothetical protein
MKYIYFFILITLSSCENKQVYSTYKKANNLINEASNLINEAKLMYDSAIIDLKLTTFKNDSLPSVYFPK